MKFTFCGDTKQHGRHEWYWKNILRRGCAGNAEIDWDSVPLAGYCAHGVGMLDQGDDCCPTAAIEREMDSLVREHAAFYHQGGECVENEHGECTARFGGDR